MVLKMAIANKLFAGKKIMYLRFELFKRLVTQLDTRAELLQPGTLAEVFNSAIRVIEASQHSPGLLRLSPLEWSHSLLSSLLRDRTAPFSIL
jgi:hypothetical protein